MCMTGSPPVADHQVSFDGFHDADRIAADRSTRPYADHSMVMTPPFNTCKETAFSKGRTEESDDRRGTRVDLSRYETHTFSRGRSRLIEVLWLVTEACLVSTPIPGSALRVLALRAFGARIGPGVVIKPRVRVKFPWRLTVGSNSWIGEGVWIDNLADVSVGDNVCISQGAYLCTGSHDWRVSTFNLVTAPITIFDGAWIAAMATIAPGVKVGTGAVLSLGSVAHRDLKPFGIYQGNPACLLKMRDMADEDARRGVSSGDREPLHPS